MGCARGGSVVCGVEAGLVRGRKWVQAHGGYEEKQHEKLAA